MPYGIETVTVIGAGTMGAAIAGHLANAGIRSWLLDIVPSELTAEEEAAGLTLADRKVRNRIVQAGYERMVKAKPANLFTQSAASLITVGNLEDDFDAAVGASDWIIEVIIERPGPKQALMARIEKVARPTAIISSNTSGIPIHIIAEGRTPEFKRRFLGTHFFNPPRYLHLLEIIPTPDTDPAIVSRMKDFAENVLGKGVVVCKDTPNFVANRMISFIQSDIMEFAIENGYTVEAVDALTGPLLGRPKTGTFRLNDIVGIDVMALVGSNLYDLIPDDEDREILRGEYGSAVMKLLIDNKLLGAKTGQGFYKTVVDEKGKKSFWGLDLQTAAEDGKLEYLPPKKPKWSSVGEARNLPLADRLKALVDADDEAGELIWHTLSRTMAYASKRVPEIADSLVDIDNAMKWGFAWEMGPFETWDELGVKQTVARLEGEGVSVAPWVKQMLAAGKETFYTYANGKQMVYDPARKEYVEVARSPKAVSMKDIRRTRKELAGNEMASLWDIGDGVMLLEWHTRVNALDGPMFDIMQEAIERLHGNASGLVIANDGKNFAVGANIFAMLLAVQSQMWGELEMMIKFGQDAFMGFRTAPKPVVAAPHQMALGGGCEICLAADRIVADAETYIGLVEVGIGVIPGWGGCKEMVRRHVSPHMNATNVNPMPYLRKVFETVGFAKVSTSGEEARELGFLAPTDRVVLNSDHRIAEAKQAVLTMNDAGYRAPNVKGNVYAAGRDMLAAVNIEVHSMIQGGYISEHDGVVACKLGYVLAGGDLSQGQWMDEQYFLDLEREAFLSLVGEKKTQDRIQYMLENNKPLRN
ncbi:MAG TPA: 3-hydroxyacyl-CoA dehydrogenase [Chloroflexi bacterium]|nr:3-hydroxyacyl-CoA dehydrogenase [Chloroflexota bacterium]HHW86215.1 3-hydroxyacyl-CoA dehydrogenase/enoyl-CoA hydratase family protein [Chloroflexota bacterium]